MDEQVSKLTQAMGRRVVKKMVIVYSSPRKIKTRADIRPEQIWPWPQSSYWTDVLVKKAVSEKEAIVGSFLAALGQEGMGPAVRRCDVRLAIVFTDDKDAALFSMFFRADGAVMYRDGEWLATSDPLRRWVSQTISTHFES